MPKKSSNKKRLARQAASVSGRTKGNRNRVESKSEVAEQLRLGGKVMAEYREVFERLAKS